MPHPSCDPKEKWHPQSTPEIPENPGNTWAASREHLRRASLELYCWKFKALTNMPRIHKNEWNCCPEGLALGWDASGNDRVWVCGIHAQFFRKTEKSDECSFLNYFSFKSPTDLVRNAEVIKTKFYFMISCVDKTIIFFPFSPLLQSLPLSSPLLLSLSPYLITPSLCWLLRRLIQHFHPFHRNLLLLGFLCGSPALV